MLLLRDQVRTTVGKLAQSTECFSLGRSAHRPRGSPVRVIVLRRCEIWGGARAVPCPASGFALQVLCGRRPPRGGIPFPCLANRRMRAPGPTMKRSEQECPDERCDPLDWFGCHVLRAGRLRRGEGGAERRRRHGRFNEANLGPGRANSGGRQAARPAPPQSGQTAQAPAVAAAETTAAPTPATTQYSHWLEAQAKYEIKDEKGEPRLREGGHFRPPKGASACSSQRGGLNPVSSARRRCAGRATPASAPIGVRALLPDRDLAEPVQPPVNVLLDLEIEGFGRHSE